MINLVWFTLLAVHTAAAGVWWWLMPGGFPSSTPQYWVNEVAPVFCIALLLTALFARGKFSHAVLPAVVAAIPAFWLAFGISARLTFADSFGSSWMTAFIPAAIIGGLWVNQFRLRLTAKWLVPVVVVPALIAGWLLPGTQRAADPSTTPTGAAFTAPTSGAGDSRLVKLTREAQLRPGDSRVVFKRDKMILNVQPLLTFANRSPDRCWTALAPEGTSTPTNRILVARQHDGARWTMTYKDEDASVLEVATAPGGGVQLDGRSRLPRAIYSHGNTFAELTVQGHQKLTVSFSPLPDRRIEVPPATQPARFAYFDGNDTFHLVQASAEQRGPFTEIAAGRLKRGDPLVVTFYDNGKAAFSVTLEDWSAQASTELSPTAGWGLPVNAIEMVRGGDAESTPALITFTLASTSIGRGTQSVGHAPGVYRDRITVSAAAP